MKASDSVTDEPPGPQYYIPPTDGEKVPPIAASRSKTMRDILELAGRVARFDSSVLITGETGSGKEVLARYIHSVSPRSKRPLLTISCSALPETLLESELFGHKAGSFTGAVQDRVGLFEQAARGTILLDEVGDISPAIQVKLLRVLQEREILRIGENIPRKVDIRVIAATNRQLDEAVAKGKFREDLLYRLRVVEIVLPPLRERTEDILPLTMYFVKRLAKKLNLPDLRLEDSCRDHLQSYAWPGNARELQNALERAAVLGGDGVIRAKHLPRQILNRGPATGQFNISPPRTLAEIEFDYIKMVLQMTGGNRARAAKILGIGQSTLWRKLKR